MLCPIDQTTLAITERQGIEIDYCPKCRGVWLDRGELDKIIDAGSVDARPASRPPDRPEERYDDRDRRPDDHYKSDDRHKYEKKRKKEGFLSDLFDF